MGLCWLGCRAVHYVSDLSWSRESRHKRGYGTAWDKLRKQILLRDKHLCQACLPDRVTPANQVDHIIPRANGGTDDPDNLRALCKDCHDTKTILDNGGKPKPKIGLDGWPT